MGDVCCVSCVWVDVCCVCIGLCMCMGVEEGGSVSGGRSMRCFVVLKFFWGGEVRVDICALFVKVT